MKISLPHINDKSLFCDEAAWATILTWFGYDYEPMLAGTWGFELNKNDPATQIGMLLNPQITELSLMIKNIYGIKFNSCSGNDMKRNVAEITNDIGKEVPVIIIVDTFWYPFDDGYKRYHQNHAFIINGIDNNGFCCVDPFYSKYDFYIANDKMNNLYKMHTHIISNKNRIIQHDYIKNLNDVYDKLNNCGRNTTAFQDIRTFATLIQNKFDFSVEFGSSDNIWLSPLLRNLDIIAKGRMKFSKFLSYVGKAKQSKDIEIIGEKWAIVRLMFAKAYLRSKYSKSISNKIYDELNNISIEEEKLAKNMIIDEKNTAVLNFKYAKKVHLTNCIDISKYCNNRGFGDYENSLNSDLTGFGEYFSLENIPSDSILCLDEMRFSLTFKNEQPFDNISCYGQYINLTAYYYNQFMILACSEWGNYTGKFKIDYFEGKSDEIYLSFSDWCQEPSENESIAWIGQGIRIHNNIPQKFSKEVKLFSQSVSLDIKSKIIGVELPNCPNIHIFAILFAQ
jgi:hypothetical protein